MTEKALSKNSVSAMLKQIGELTDAEIRVIIHLVVVGYPVYDAIDILKKHLYGKKKGQTP